MARGTSEPTPEPDEPGGSADGNVNAAGRSPGLFVTLITALALAAIGYVGYQAHASDDRPLSSHGSATEEASDKGQEDGDPDADDGSEGAEGPDAPDAAPALPADSGEGKRVVYSLSERHVWLVDQAADGTGDQILLDHPVHPSTVDPEPGSYLVTSRTGELTGSDGVPIRHSVVFHTDGEVVFGFSTAVDGSVPDPDGAERTGGIRQDAEAGAEMWEFSGLGTSVVVTP